MVNANDFHGATDSETLELAIRNRDPDGVVYRAMHKKQ